MLIIEHKSDTFICGTRDVQLDGLTVTVSNRPGKLPRMPYDVEGHLKQAREENYSLLYAVADGKTLGWLSINEGCEELGAERLLFFEVAFVYVDVVHRGRGVASLLAKKAAKHMAMRSKQYPRDGLSIQVPCHPRHSVGKKVCLRIWTHLLNSNVGNLVDPTALV